MNVFSSLREALNAGYHVYGKTESGCLVRLRTNNGWALAVIALGRNERERSVQPDTLEGQ